jgi:hypothetical protein
MKKQLFILILILFSFGAKAGDTVMIKPIRFSIKSEISKVLFNASITGCYDTLTKYCNSSVTLYTDFDGETRTEDVSDVKLISELNDFIQQVPFTYMKVLNGKNKLNEEVFVVELYWSKDNPAPLVQMFFRLDSKEAIRVVVILAN